MSRTINSLRGAASGASTGAAIGSVFGPGPGTAIGAAVGGVAGALAGAFTPSEEEVRQKRINALLARYNQMKADELKALDEATTRGAQRISQQSSGQKSSARAGIARRAASAGRGGDNEAYILSAENNINSIASSAMRDLVGAAEDKRSTIESGWNKAIADVRFQEASAPQGPDAVDVLESIGGPALTYLQNQEYLKTLTGQGGDAAAGGGGDQKKDTGGGMTFVDPSKKRMTPLNPFAGMGESKIPNFLLAPQQMVGPRHVGSVFGLPPATRPN